MRSSPPRRCGRLLRTRLGRLEARVWARADARFAWRAVAELRRPCRAALYLLFDRRRGLMTVLSVLDAAGRRRSPATLPGYHAGRPPRNKGMRYPADPPTAGEIVGVMGRVRDDRHGWRVRAMIVVLWRAGLRVQEALALAEYDLDHRRGWLLV